MAEANYSNIYKIKEFAANELAPKYFNMDQVNQINVGLLGYTTELIANTTEDAFNAISMLMNEMFPNMAVLPESIYNYAALFQIDDLFATPAKLAMALLVSEEDIHTYATKVQNSSGTQSEELYEFYIDSDTIISVEGVNYSPDYDIQIRFKPYRNDYIYTAMYYKKRYGANFNNMISDINNPYIKTKRVNINKEPYILLIIHTHQIDKFTKNETILSNDIVNLPTYTIDFDGIMAGFEVFYKSPTDLSYTQLTKRMDGSAPLKTPFCFYRFRTDNQLEISFTARDNYFQPKFNSELKIDYYTSNGSKGNFTEYVGNDVVVQSKGENYDYNTSVNMFARPIGESFGGLDKLSLDQLKALVIERFSTVNSYTTENDLQLFFDSFNAKYKSNILFVKKRDDVMERLFTSYSMIKDSNEDVFHTNTLNLDLTSRDFDGEYDQSDIFVLKPGKLFTYKSDNPLEATSIPGTIEEFEDDNKRFVYTNPYLIYFMKSPAIVGYYMNGCNMAYEVNYAEANNKSLVQFTCGPLQVIRNALLGDTSYHITLTLTPTTELENPIVIEKVDDTTGEISYIDRKTLVVRLIFESNGVKYGFLDMDLRNYDKDADAYMYETHLETDDYIDLNNRIRVLNLYSMDSNYKDFKIAPKMIPMNDCNISIQTWYRYEGCDADDQPETTTPETP